MDAEVDCSQGECGAIAPAPSGKTRIPIDEANGLAGFRVPTRLASEGND